MHRLPLPEMTNLRECLLLLASAALVAMLLPAAVPAQSRRSAKAIGSEGEVIAVTARRTDSKTDPIRPENLYFYENGVEQKIRNFTFDPSPSRIVILVDNSQSVPAELDRLRQAVMEFVYEIFEGDQLFIIAFDEKPEIIQEWTDSEKAVQSSLATFRKRGNPYLFDAIEAAIREVIVPLMPGIRKTALVVISDGLDRGSKAKFEDILDRLQTNDITTYFLSMPDRSGGVFRRNQPKAATVVAKLTGATGGSAFPIEEAQLAAKSICEELRKNRYLLSYQPVNASAYDARRFLLLADKGIEVRMKTAQPPEIKSN
ncbi:MAG: hypothetical protein C4325_01375 [Blastocatellia bacterium]